MECYKYFKITIGRMVSNFSCKTSDFCQAEYSFWVKNGIFLRFFRKCRMTAQAASERAKRAFLGREAGNSKAVYTQAPVHPSRWLAKRRKRASANPRCERLQCVSRRAAAVSFTLRCQHPSPLVVNWWWWWWNDEMKWWMKQILCLIFLCNFFTF